MTSIDTRKVDSALLDLEGILHALDLVRMEGGLNKPGAEFHALAVLSRLAVQHVAQVRLAIFPEVSSGHDREAAR